MRPLRILATLGLVCAGAVVLMLLASGFVDGSIWLAGVLHLQHALGMDTQTSKQYMASSGSLPMVVTSFSFAGAGVATWHHLNCHAEHCWKIGRFPVAGGQYRTCRKDHPDPAVREGVKAHHLLAAHEKHQNR